MSGASGKARPAAVVIGRNEGARLAACLASVAADCAPVVYVDSGSTDDSVALARAAGATVVSLDMTRPFTAARARNAGAAAAREAARAGLAAIQFVDGDCTVEPGWIATACSALDADDDLAVVCGRRRETAPGASPWNRLCDMEWNTPVGEAAACGGDALMRLAAFEAAGGFREDLIAGEEPELCLRLRRLGWRIRRLDAPMTRHDAQIMSARQWRLRTRRAGWAAAEGAWLHGGGDERYNLGRLRSMAIWGLGLPAGWALALAVWGWGLMAGDRIAILGASGLALALWLGTAAQDRRVARRRMAVQGDGPEDAMLYARETRRGKIAELGGALRFLAARLAGWTPRIIEYKRRAGR